MYNRKHQKKTAQQAYEKYLRDNALGPTAEDAVASRPPAKLQEDNVGGKANNAQIHEKKLPHREGDKDTITEDQMKAADRQDSDAPIIEKVLNEATSSYVDHRSDATWLPVPPMADLVERIRQDRLDEHWKTDKEAHWSQTFNEKKQQGSLPRWKKNVSQHDKIVLENDPDRFKGEIKPLIGGITTADVDRIAHGIKTGASIDYDTMIVAILKQADQEKRELNTLEKTAIIELKKKRTQSLLH